MKYKNALDTGQSGVTRQPVPKVSESENIEPASRSKTGPCLLRTTSTGRHHPSSADKGTLI